MILARGLIIGLWIFLALFATSSSAEEQRCKELGANCVCSEPLNTNILVKKGDSWYNPADSVQKECSKVPSIPGSALERNSNDLFGSNDSTVLAKLPSGHQVNYFVRGPNGHVGMWAVGEGYLGSKFVKRAAARWYIYHSPDFEFAGENQCQNSKMAQFTSALLDKSFGYVHMYNFLDWNPAQDCCMNGPGPQNVNKSYWRGKWVRVEVVFTNRAGPEVPGVPPGFEAKVYLKNITDNSPELLVIDTTASGTQLTPSDTRTPPKRQDSIWINNHRWPTCKGWIGISHYMVAGWDTNEGQRIGGAVEIENGLVAKDTLAPSSPTGLRVQSE